MRTMKARCSGSEDGELGPGGPRRERRNQVGERGRDEHDAEQRVDAAAGQRGADGHRRRLPSRRIRGVLVVDLQVAADAFGADVQRVNRFDSRRRGSRGERSRRPVIAEQQQQNRNKRPAEQRYREQRHPYGSPEAMVWRRHLNSDSVRLIVRGTCFGMAEAVNVGPGDVKVYISPCNLQGVCYNADTSRNKLSLKGLPVNQTSRLFRTVRLICLLTAVASFGLAGRVDGRGSSTRSTSKPTSTAAPKRLTLQKKPATKTASTTRSRQAAAAGQGVQLLARQAREVAEPRFKLDDTGALVPDVRAEAAIIYNPENGKVLWESNSQNQRSIASITKVMTAVVFLENDPDLTQTVVVTPTDVRAASTTYLRAGYVADARTTCCT